jgi:tetratricopeptide (TPR) repeat protein
MRSIKLINIICIVVCSLLFISNSDSYGANSKADDLFNEGMRYALVKNYDNAIHNYTEAIRLNPKLIKAYINRGAAYMGIDRYDLAIADFNKAIKLDPKNGKAYNNRAVAHWYTGEAQKARADAQKAQNLGISVNPDFLKKIQEQPPATQK